MNRPRSTTRRTAAAALACAVALALAACTGGGPAPAAANDPDAATRVVVDHWDREVVVPRDVDRAAVMEWEGLVAKSMMIFGLADRIVAVDTATKKQTFRNELVPAIEDAVDVGSAWSGVNYEQLAALDVDVVFLEAWVASEENRTMHAQEIEKIEALGIPVIVFVSPSNFEEPDIATAWEHIEIVGEVFDKQDEAAALVERLERELDVVRERTADIPQDQRADVLMFATVDNVMGAKSIQSYFLTEVLHANNVAGPGTFITVSEEQMLAFDPDVLLVLGHDGYLDAERIYVGEHVGLNWANLQGMRAIAGRRVASVGYDEWRATVEAPIGLLKMAKVIYPDRFADVDVAAAERAFYQDVYGLSEQDARTAVDAQHYLGELANQ